MARALSPCRVVAVTLTLLALALAFGTVASAQITSSLSGRVLDQQGLALSAADIQVYSKELGVDRKTQSDATGTFRLLGLLPGAYQVSVTKAGFVSKKMNLEVTVNTSVNEDIQLAVASVQSEVSVVDTNPLLETTTSSSGMTITPKQIQEMPLNGRNYLDLLQLVPGVALNKQADEGSDSSTPILGERSGNAQFLIDGLPNSDAVNGGAAAQFNQESILEFQVITAGYKAEFGHGSGGIINVVSRSGTNDLHGGISFFHRDSVFDSSDISGQSSAPFLLRYDPSGQFGGPIVKDKVFFFLSGERIRESRSLNFQFPANIPQSLIDFETPFNRHSQTYDTRIRGKVDEQLGRHRLTEQYNYTNTHITDFLPLSAALNLPSTRNNIDSRHSMFGLSDIYLLGDQANPFIVDGFYQYRREPSKTSPAHPQAGAALTLDNLFSSLTTNQNFGDLGQVEFGPGYTPILIDQQYHSAGLHVAKQYGRHAVKFGWDYQYTHVDGTEANNLFNQLFATVDNFSTYGPIDSGVTLLTFQGGLTPADNQIRLRNNYNGIFMQDDWRVIKSLTINYGLRWDYDSKFPSKTDFSPRIGLAWSVTNKTVVRASWGLFYDRFRLGLARDIPGLGGADITKTRYLGFPQGFYDNPSAVVDNFGVRGLGAPCVSNTMTDAQIAASGAQCTYLGVVHDQPIYGIDHLNNVVAPGHAAIPLGAVINTGDVQSLSGYTAQQYADAASASIGQKPGFFGWDPFGHLSTSVIAGIGALIPITVDPSFKTPYTSAAQVGIQHEFGKDFVVEANYYHKDIFNILGVRNTNLAFAARIPNSLGQLVPGTGPSIIQGYGPWFAGTYNAGMVSVRKRFSKLSLQATYTYTHATDDATPDLVSENQFGSGLGFAANSNGPMDSFVGIVPVVTDPTTGKTNATGAFVASNGNPVPQAGKFYNGAAALGTGPSDLSLTHTFLIHGIYTLPKGFSFSSIFRAQSGFHYSASAVSGPDVDGDGLVGGFDYTLGRNRFTAPAYVNWDMRVAHQFKIRERVTFHSYLELFNLLNRGNPAAVQSLPGQPQAFGSVLQVLPGRETQIGIRLEF
jgi:hypothetical protein